jgi:hypothetical protein
MESLYIKKSRRVLLLEVPMNRSWVWQCCMICTLHEFPSDSRNMAGRELLERRYMNRNAMKRTAFHGGVNFCINRSFVGGSLRMCWIHECHSGGTCVALKSCWEKKVLACIFGREKFGTHLSEVNPSMTTFGKQRKEISLLQRVSTTHTWNLFFRIPIFKIPVTKSANKESSLDDPAAENGRNFRRTDLCQQEPPL